jgi:hypothetical protein
MMQNLREHIKKKLINNEDTSGLRRLHDIPRGNEKMWAKFTCGEEIRTFNKKKKKIKLQQI